jgi:hypothetical protein
LLLLFISTTTSAFAKESEATAEPGDEVPDSETKASEEAREAYRKQFIWFEGLEDVEHHGAMVTDWSNVYVGKQKYRLEPEEFYRKVGRPDLAEEYESRWRRRLAGATMYGVGALGVVFGSVWWIERGINDGNMTAPALITVGSAAALLAGRYIAPHNIHPVTASEAQDLADDHNGRLKQDLGLPPSDSALPRTSAQPLKLDFGVGAAPGGVAGVLTIEF